jgi:transcriptional regulator with XRE-family HTH domain
MAMRATLSSCTRPSSLAQARAACIINRVENIPVAGGIERPDPEVQAGRALRRLRLSQRWSQEEVARRMQAYGYDFHQTTIAKIEAAQRPLRVRELADFAALYGVEIHELVYPSNGSLAEIDEEIAQTGAQYETALSEAEAAAMERLRAQAVLARIEDQDGKLRAEVAMLSGRLAFLREERKKFALWEADEEAANQGPGIGA